jgi:hypothetical protein
MTAEFEAESARRGYKRVYLHARVVAVDFYLKLGYELFGEEFIEVNIPHRHMQKFVQPVVKDTDPKIEEDLSTSKSAISFSKWLTTAF